MTFSDLQLSTPAGGGMHMMPLDYEISLRPIRDIAKYGILAHVSEETQALIFAAGEGELARNVDYIRRRIAELKKKARARP